MADRQVRIVIAADVASAIRGMAEVERGLGRVGNSGRQASTQASSIGDKLKEAFTAAGVVGGIAGVAAAIGFVVKQGVSFQDNMNSLKAVTGASAGEMTRLSIVARGLGKDIDLPATSASDASEALLELAKGGLSVNESMAAAKGTLLLAAAASVTGGEAATIQANALNAFALSGDQANHVADVLANTANAASGEITDFAAGMQQSATVAHSFGIGIEDTATTLGLFAKAGIQGSDAGTSFKTMLTALASPTAQQQKALDALNLTVYDAKGNFVGMKSITEQLAAAKGNLSQQEYNAAASTAFGSDAIRAANILAEGGVGAWNSMSEAVGRAGGAQELAAAKTEGVSGAMGKVQSAVEDAAIELFEHFAPAIEKSLGFMASLVSGAGSVMGALGSLTSPVVIVGGALLTVVLLRAPLAALFDTIAIKAMYASGAVTGFSFAAMRASMTMAAFGTVAKGALAALGGPLGLALLAGASALAFFSGSSDEAAGSTANFTGAIDENTGALSANAPAVIANASANSGAFDAYKKIGGLVGEYTNALMGNLPAQDAVHTRILDAATAAIEGSSAWTKYKSSGLAAGETARTTASHILETGDAGNFASDGLSAAMDSSRLFASETDILGTSAQNTADVLEATGGAVAGVAGAAEEAAPVVKGLEDSFKAASEAMKVAVENAEALANSTGLAVALSNAGLAADNAKRALDGFNLAQEEASTRNETLDDSTASYQASLSGVEEALKSGTKAAKENAEAGNLNMDALNSWDVAALTATSDGRGLYNSLSSLATQHTATTAAAYSDAVANGNLAGANDVARTAATNSRAAFVSLMQQHGLNEEQANTLADRLGVLDGQKIDDKTFKVISDDAKARADFQSLQNMQFAQKLMEITAQDNATYTIYNIQGALDAMSSYKQIVVETVVRGSAVAVENGGVFDQPFANGGVPVIGGRGQSRMRTGAGDGVRWGEAQTGREYYLSMKNGQEKRNRLLTTAAVGELGGQVNWGGDVRAGTFTPAMQPAPVSSSNTGQQGGIQGVTIHNYAPGDVVSDLAYAALRF